MQKIKLPKVRWNRPGMTIPTTEVGILAYADPPRAKARLIEAIEETKGNSSQAARLLEMGRFMFYFYLERYGLKGYPKEVRDRHKAKFESRFRLPPLKDERKSHAST